MTKTDYEVGAWDGEKNKPRGCSMAKKKSRLLEKCAIMQASH